MDGAASAYAVLGLGPEADSVEIEQAYRRLIKRHHPDRAGGDPERAAEINRAYGELCAVRRLKDPLELDVDRFAPRRRSDRVWLVVALAAAVASVALLSKSSLLPVAQLRPITATNRKSVRATVDRMDEPVHAQAVDSAALDALRMSRSGDEIALASTSSDCHRRLRSNPSLVQLDRCAAFDDAVIQLRDRDPLRDRGPFSELAVTGRQWSGATELSGDSVAIDGRLDRIRLRVEFALASASLAPPPPKND